MQSKVLVAFFSASGVTRRAARLIARTIGADCWEIEPKSPYTTRDLDWRDSSSRSSVEMDDPSSRPALRHPVPDISGYDAVLLGFPIWWGVAPRAVDTFLDAVDLTGKKLIIFATSGSSAIDEALACIKRMHPGVEVQGGKLLNDVDPARWARSLKL